MILPNTRAGAFGFRVVNGVVTSLAFKYVLGPSLPNGLRTYDLLAGNGRIAGGVKTLSGWYERALGGASDANSTGNGYLHTSFVGFLAGYLAVPVMDWLWVKFTGMDPERKSHNFTSFTKNTLLSALGGSFVVLPLVKGELPPSNFATLNGPKDGIRVAMIFAGAQVASQLVYEKLMVPELVEIYA